MNQHFFEILAVKTKHGQEAPRDIPEVVASNQKSTLIQVFNSDFGMYNINAKYLTAYQHLVFRIENAITDVCDTAAEKGNSSVVIVCNDASIESSDLTIKTQNHVPSQIMDFAFTDVIENLKCLAFSMHSKVQSHVTFLGKRSVKIEWHAK